MEGEMNLLDGKYKIILQRGWENLYPSSYNPNVAGNGTYPGIRREYEEGDKKSFATQGKNEINEFAK